MVAVGMVVVVLDGPKAWHRRWVVQGAQVARCGTLARRWWRVRWREGETLGKMIWRDLGEALTICPTARRGDTTPLCFSAVLSAAGCAARWVSRVKARSS